MIVVTGASGLLGKGIVEALLRRLPAHEIGVSVRQPARAAHLASLGVRVRQGDYEDGASLRHAFEGAHTVLLVSSNASAEGKDPIAQHQTAIASARAAGVTRLVYTSHMAASHDSAFPPMRDHATTEALLAGSGLAWTALRNGFYAASGLVLLGDARTSGLVAAPADGKVAWTAHADLAEAAAILTGHATFEGPTPPLTGAAALDLTDLARLLSEVAGVPVTRTVVDDDAFRARLVTFGVPAPRIAIVLGLYEASRRGEFATVDPTLTRLLGRAPTTMRDLLAAPVRPPSS